MAKKRRTRKQKKKQRQTHKPQSRWGWRRRKQQTPPSLHMDADMAEALTPLLSGSETQAAHKLTDALFESNRFADEPELEEFLFDPQTSALMFIKTTEEMGWSADAYFDADEEKRAEMFSEIAEQIIPALLTNELHQELLDGLETLAHRYQQQRQRKRAAQATFVRLVLADETQKEMWPLVELLQRITSRSVKAGFTWMGMIDEIEQEASGLLNIPGKLAQSEVMTRVVKKVERIPGLRRLAEKQFDQIMAEAETAVYNGALHLGLFTENELAGAVEIMTKHVEPFAKEGKSPEDIPDETGENVIVEMDAYLLQLLTPKRLTQIQAHLHTIMQGDLIDGKWLGIIGLLHENLGKEDAAEMERPFLFRALMGELQAAMLITNPEEA